MSENGITIRTDAKPVAQAIADGGLAANSAAPDGFITKRDVARRLNKTVRTVDNWMKRGILPYYKLGRTVAFRWSDVEAHLAANYRVCLRRGA